MNNDLISRQQAIDEVIALPNCENGYSDTYDKGRFISLLEELPPAEKRGKWIISKVNGQYQCSNCGMFTGLTAEDVESGFYLMKYCGNCGARM